MASVASVRPGDPPPSVEPGQSQPPSGATPPAPGLTPPTPGLTPPPATLPPGTVATLGGLVLAPTRLIVDNGLGVVSNNGGSVVSNNGAGFISDQGGGFISDQGGGLISDKGGAYNLLASKRYGLAATTDLLPFAGARVTLYTAAGKPVLGPDGKPLFTFTDAAGRYAFTAPLPANNLVATIGLSPTLGRLSAIVPGALGAGAAARGSVPIDLVSSLTTGYILEQYVKGQPEPITTLDRLPADVEAETRAKASASFASGTTAAPTSLSPAAVVALVDGLRGQDASFNAQMDKVKALLIVAGQADFGNGLAATRVALSVSGLAGGPDGTLYISSERGNRIWRLMPDGTLRAAAGLGSGEGEAAIAGRPAADTNLQAPLAVGFDAEGRLQLVDSARVSTGPDSYRQVSRAARLEADGTLGGVAQADHLYDVVVPGPGAEVWGFARRFDGTGSGQVGLWALAAGQAERRLVETVRDASELYAAGRLDATRVRFAALGADGKPAVFDLDTGSGQATPVALGAATSATVDVRGNLFTRDAAGTLAVTKPGGAAQALATGAAIAGLDSLRRAKALLMPDGTAIVAASGKRGHSLVYRLAAGQATLVAGVDGDAAAGDALEMPLQPNGLAAGADGRLFLSSDNQVMRVAPGQAIARYAGTNKAPDYAQPAKDDFDGATGPALQANLRGPSVVRTDAAGNLYVLENDQKSARIRRIDPAGTISLAREVQFSDQVSLNVSDFVVTPGGEIYFLSKNKTQNRVIGRWDAEGALTVATSPGNPVLIFGFGRDANMALGPGDSIYFSCYRTDLQMNAVGQLWRWKASEGFTLALEHPDFRIAPIVFDPRGRLLLSTGKQIKAYDLTTKTFSEIAGPGARHFSGRTVDTSLGDVLQLTLDGAGNLYIADWGHGQVKQIPAGAY